MIKRNLRGVTQLGSTLSDIDRIPAIVPLAILNRNNAAPVGIGLFQQQFGEFAISEFGTSTDVVHLARSSTG